ncbi:MAG: hypothetical protein KA533_05045 [Sphingobium sp.]|nr:hypothetical protein [Sphingobium sp.]MBP6112769.1 hypothetical protein [Sphingobium sp.]MBP8671401.1 hypothetical protein [Sphingobium sp.]MBP9156270.1 hypothetical protein [Sphingobium sp.]
MNDDELDRTARQDKCAAPAQPDAIAPERTDGSSLKPFADVNVSLGTVLRSIYQQTVEESIPDEMLDLLKRLN